MGIMPWNCVFVKHKNEDKNILFGECLSRRQGALETQSEALKALGVPNMLHMDQSKIKGNFYMGEN